MKKTKPNPHARALGKIGGKMRAKKYSKKQLSTWGKLGGRPRTRLKEIDTVSQTTHIS